MAKSTQQTSNDYNVFLSWSGERSLYVARFFHQWLPRVLHRAKPWLSDVDIDKGTVGLDEIKAALSGMRVGILCLTPENRNSLWMCYEGGVLSQEIGEKSRICPYLLGGLQLKHLKGPLGMFQLTKSEREDTRKLIHTINRAISEDTIPSEHLDIIFDRLWPELESHIARIPTAEQLSAPLPSIDEMIDEILQLSRAAANSRKQSEWMDQFTTDFKDFLPMFLQVMKSVNPSQLLSQPPPPPTDPKVTFCVKLVGDSSTKRIEGAYAVQAAAGQLIIAIGNDVVAKFESVESWWREQPTDNASGLKRRRRI